MEAAEKALTLEQSVEWFDENLMRTAGSYVVDRLIDDPGILAEWLNRDFFDHVLRGVSNPKVSRDGFVVDETKRRPYTREEVMLLLTFPSVQTYIAELRKERDIERKQDQAEARVAQLAEARFIKATRREAELVPVLFAELAKALLKIEWLVDQ